MAKRKPSQLNLLLAVDKPVGCTSHDVVGMVRRAVNERRVGHAGTLDPLASGVMVIGIGQATRLLGMLTLDTKAYVADISFGYETNTDDAEGEKTQVVAPRPQLYEEEYARGVLAGFVGKQSQVPPAFSAISVNGVRAYKAARAGEEVQLEPREIEVYAAELIHISQGCCGPVWTVAFSVSKGSYIRALARDIGRAADCAAHVSALRRTASGSISLGSCVALSGLDAEVAQAHALDPVHALGYERLDAPEDQLSKILSGQALELNALQSHVVEKGTAGLQPNYAVCVNNELRALGSVEANKLRLNHVFPQGIAGVAS